MLERDALRELLLDKGIITEVEFVARFEKLEMQQKAKRER